MGDCLSKTVHLCYCHAYHALDRDFAQGCCICLRWGGHSTKHGLDWTGQLDWTIGLDSWTGQLDWTVGLDSWTGLLDWDSFPLNRRNSMFLRKAK